MSNNEDNSLYMLLGEMRGDLKSIIGSLSTMRDDHRQLREEVEKNELKHDTRLTQLEKFRWQLAGIALVLPFAVTALGWYLRSI